MPTSTLAHINLASSFCNPRSTHMCYVLVPAFPVISTVSVISLKSRKVMSHLVQFTFSFIPFTFHFIPLFVPFCELPFSSSFHIFDSSLLSTKEKANMKDRLVIPPSFLFRLGIIFRKKSALLRLIPTHMLNICLSSTHLPSPSIYFPRLTHIRIFPLTCVSC